jgi:microcystin degradation protein MlrC
MRVGILGLLHESNTFLPAKTRWQHFADETIARGEEIRIRLADAQHEIGGFFAGLQSESIEPVPLYVARALPYGTIEADAFDRLTNEMFQALRSAGPLDGLLVAPHGATVSQLHPDADGYWLTEVRRIVGSHVPIVGTLDPHANLSPQMVNACDALIAYRTNPHVDQRERGVEAAHLLARMVKQGLRPTMAARYPPIAISIECQCTDEAPCDEIYRLADDMLSTPGVLTNSIVLGFPYADVAEMGSAVIVVTDNEAELAQSLAAQLAGAMWQRRHALVGRPVGIVGAIEQALRDQPPVCLLDMGDNVGGGSSADGTWIAHVLMRRQITRSLIAICDPAAVRGATAAGAGARVRLRVGGRSGPINGPPLDADFRVKSLHDGRFTESRPLHGGFSEFDQGPTAVLSTDDGPTIVVTSRRMVPFSLGQLTSCGLDPAAHRILVAKGVNAPIAAYREVCRTFIRVNTPGYTCADMTALTYSQRRRPMFPFERDTTWDAGQ